MLPRQYSLMMVATCYRNVGNSFPIGWYILKPLRCLIYLATQAFSRILIYKSIYAMGSFNSLYGISISKNITLK